MWPARSTAMQNREKLALLGGTPVRSRLLPYAHQTIDSGDIAAVGEALSSSLITQGPTLERFERALAGRARVKHAVGFSSGTAALHGACWASGLGPGDRAITTPLTFAARSEEHTSELQSLAYLVCRLLLEKKKKHRLRGVLCDKAARHRGRPDAKRPLFCFRQPSLTPSISTTALLQRKRAIPHGAV